MLQGFEVFKAGISDSCIPEDERLEFAQTTQVHEAGIGDSGTRQVKSLESCQAAGILGTVYLIIENGGIKGSER